MSEHPDGYLATPVTGNGGAVLVLHAWWGLNDTFRGLCDRLADAGYLAFAPDLYHGRVANTIDNAENLMRALDDAQAGADLAAATDFLYERGGRRAAGLAVIGFSMGANYALELAERGRPPAAAVRPRSAAAAPPTRVTLPPKTSSRSRRTSTAWPMACAAPAAR